MDLACMLQGRSHEVLDAQLYILLKTTLCRFFPQPRRA